MEFHEAIRLNRLFAEEFHHIIADPQYALLYGSKSINPDKEDIKVIKNTLYREIYEGKSIFDNIKVNE